MAQTGMGTGMDGWMGTHGGGGGVRPGTDHSVAGACGWVRRLVPGTRHPHHFTWMKPELPKANMLEITLENDVARRSEQTTDTNPHSDRQGSNGGLRAEGVDLDELHKDVVAVVEGLGGAGARVARLAGGEPAAGAQGRWGAAAAPLPMRQPEPVRHDARGQGAPSGTKDWGRQGVHTTPCFDSAGVYKLAR